MDKDEALRILKELAQQCPAMGKESLSLKESEPNDETSKGFQIIVGGIDKDNKTCLRKGINQYNLLTKEVGDKIVIYTPKTNQCPECGKIFSSRRELKAHITLVHYNLESEQTEMPTGSM